MFQTYLFLFDTLKCARARRLWTQMHHLLSTRNVLTTDVLIANKALRGAQPGRAKRGPAERSEARAVNRALRARIKRKQEAIKQEAA